MTLLNIFVPEASVQWLLTVERFGSGLLGGWQVTDLMTKQSGEDSSRMGGGHAAEMLQTPGTAKGHVATTLVSQLDSTEEILCNEQLHPCAPLSGVHEEQRSFSGRVERALDESYEADDKRSYGAPANSKRTLRAALSCTWRLSTIRAQTQQNRTPRKAQEEGVRHGENSGCGKFHFRASLLRAESCLGPCVFTATLPSSTLVNLPSLV
jgi:hypothetical protein